MILEYSLIIVFGKISPINRIMIAIGMMMISFGIMLILMRYMVANEVVRIFAKFVPIKITARYSDFWSSMDDAHFDNRFPCFSQTSICNELADSSAISELE